ncbi:MAG TPA: MFS transporter, partial [Dehalococcoidia bacterium]|nr:MFS transporter [Dehalococcoidia bacterium]
GLGATVVAGLSAFVFIDVLSANLLFLISILLTGATLAMVIKHIPDTQRVAAYRRVLWRRLPVQELVSPQVLGWAATLFLIGIAMGLLGPVPRSYSRDVLGRDMVELIPYLILPISVAVLAILPCGVLADKAGRLPPMVIGLGLGAAGLLGIAMTGSLWAIMGLTTLTLLSFTLTSPAAGAAMMDLTRQETRGLLLGALGAVQGLGAAVGPSLGGRIYASVEPQAVFYLAAMLLALAMLVAAAQAVVLQQPKAYALSGA